jgi:hypothetical protein
VIRHAPPTGVTFELDGRRDGDLCVTVRNGGRWRECVDGRDGGRGLLIIDELMDGVEITKGPPDTVITMRRARGDRRAALLVRAP